MADPIDLSNLFPDARKFLGELSQDNSRDWFHQNKGRYDRELKRPAEKLLALMAQWLGSNIGATPRTKLFRPHRDMRFSEDKTPYHTHLHMMWSLDDGRAWMLGIAPEYATAGTGVMGFDKPQLERYRTAVAGEPGDELTEFLEGDWRLDPPALKRIPSPYPADHPREALLRQKGLVAWADNLEDALSNDPAATLQDVFTRSRPLINWLARVV